MSVPNPDDRSVRELISRSLHLAIGSEVQTPRQPLLRAAVPHQPLLWQALSPGQIRLRLYAVSTIAPTPLSSDSSASTDEAENECGICLDNLFQTDDSGFVVIRLNACRHAFHESCVLHLLEWDQRNRTHRDIRHSRCPLCRAHLFSVRPNSGGNAPSTGPRENVPPTDLRQLIRSISVQSTFMYQNYGVSIPRQLYGTSFPYPSQRRYVGTRYANTDAESSSSSIPYPYNVARGSSLSERGRGRSASWADYFPSVEFRNQVYTRPRLSLPLPYGNIQNTDASTGLGAAGSLGRHAGDAEPVPSYYLRYPGSR